MREVALAIVKYSPFILVIPLTTGIATFKRSSRSNRVLIIQIFFASLIGAISFLMWYRRQNNLPLMHLYTVVEFVLLSLFYFLSFDHPLAKKAVVVTGIAFVCFCLADTVYLEGVYQKNSYSRSLEALIIMAYSAYGFYCLFNRADHEKMHRVSFFWINLGYLFYFAGSFFIFLVGNHLSDMSKNVRHIVWGGHAIMMMVLYVLVSIGLWKKK